MSNGNKDFDLKNYSLSQMLTAVNTVSEPDLTTNHHQAIDESNVITQCFNIAYCENPDLEQSVLETAVVRDSAKKLIEAQGIEVETIDSVSMTENYGKLNIAIDYTYPEGDDFCDIPLKGDNSFAYDKININNILDNPEGHLALDLAKEADKLERWHKQGIRVDAYGETEYPLEDAMKAYIKEVLDNHDKPEYADITISDIENNLEIITSKIPGTIGFDNPDVVFDKDKDTIKFTIDTDKQTAELLVEIEKYGINETHSYSLDQDICKSLIEQETSAKVNEEKMRKMEQAEIATEKSVRDAEENSIQKYAENIKKLPDYNVDISDNIIGIAPKKQFKDCNWYMEIRENEGKLQGRVAINGTWATDMEALKNNHDKIFNTASNLMQEAKGMHVMDRDEHIK